MQGLMQDWPLTVDKILDHANNWHGAREVVSRSVEGPVVPEFLPETTTGLAALPRRMLTQFAGQLRGRVTVRIDGDRSHVDLLFPRASF